MSNATPPKPEKVAKKAGSSGCLGCFSVLCMIALTAFNGAALWWLDPNWLDDVSFWKGQKWEPEEELVVLPPPAPDARPETRPAPKPLLSEPVVLTHIAAVAAFEPARGAVLTLPDGARMDLPKNALPAPFEVTLAPVVKVPQPMAAAFCGGVYEFKAGSLDHVTFRTPVDLSVPYDPTLVRSVGTPTLAVWDEKKGWTKLATTADPEAKVLRAKMPHASIVGAILWGLGIGGAGLGTNPGASAFSGGRTVFENVLHPRASTYRTESFALHYYEKGGEPVPDKDSYPGSGAPAGVPPYVADLGTYLEESLVRLKALGIDVPKPKVLRWDVFIGKAGGAYGYTPYGGPIFLHHRLERLAERDDQGVEEVMRHTAAHELAHLAQPKAVGSVLDSWAAAPFMEATGGYLGDRAWKGSHPVDMASTFYLRSSLEAFPMSPWTEAEDPAHYAWGSLFRALDVKLGDGTGMAVVRHMHESKKLSLAGLEEAMATGGRDAADAVEILARLLYHDDFWGATFAPKQHSQYLGTALTAHSGAPKNFVEGVTINSAGKPEIHIAAKASVASPGMGTAHVAYVQMAPPPKSRKAKLALLIKPKGALVKFLVAADEIPPGAGRGGANTLPLQGAPAAFQEHYSSDGAFKKLWDDAGRPGGPSLVTVIGIPQSIKVATPGWDVYRWFLLAPDFVRTEKTEDGKNKITWEKTPLLDARETIDGKRLFKEYRVYRKLHSEPETNFELVKAIENAEELTDTPPYAGAWVYSVKVVDLEGNTSAYGRYDEDPFAGTWEGDFRLVSGSLMDPFNVYLEKEMTAAEEKKRAEIAKIADDDERKKAKADFDETIKLRDEYWPKVKEFLESFEQLCRAGPPITVEITGDGANKDGEFYRVKLTHLVFAPLEDPGHPGPGVRFKRVSANSLKMIWDIGEGASAEDTAAVDRLQKAFPPIELTLCHVDQETGYFEIREKSYTMSPEIDGKVEKATITWVLEKRSPRGE